jgi:hypothetical protein
MKVYQAINPSFGVGEPPAWPNEYQLVAEVDCDTLGEAFELTNAIDAPWEENEEVTSIVNPCRSTSVGDIVVDNEGKVHLCETVGWKEI